MAMSPRERADFDEIVARLRLEDAGVGTIAPRQHSMRLLIGVVAGLSMFLLALALAVLVGRPEVLAPVLVASIMLTCVLVAWRAYPRSS
ncbi:MAG: hypothetical protein ACT4O0_07585 [Pseudonocardia sp.]